MAKSRMLRSLYNYISAIEIIAKRADPDSLDVLAEFVSTIDSYLAALPLYEWMGQDAIAFKDKIACLTWNICELLGYDPRVSMSCDETDEEDGFVILRDRPGAPIKIRRGGKTLPI